MSYVKVKTKESKLLQNEYIRDLTTAPMQQRVEDCGHIRLHVLPTASPGPCSPDNQVKKGKKMQLAVFQIFHNIGKAGGRLVPHARKR